MTPTLTVAEQRADTRTAAAGSSAPPVPAATVADQQDR